MKNCANCVERQRFDQDKFQTFVCWLLFVGAVLALLPPLLVEVITQDGVGCQSTEFNIFAHYTMADWILEKFAVFKTQMAADYDEACFSLTIEDSTLTSDAKPAIWIPESEVWIDYAEYEFLDDDEYYTNRTTDCTNLTRIPVGIITWKKYADLLTSNFTPISFENITELARVGWNNFTDGAIYGVNDNVTDLFFAHGHPNHTSGGMLGLTAAYSDMVNNLANYSDTILFDRNCHPDTDYYPDLTVHDLIPKDGNITNNSVVHLMDTVIMSTSIDYSLSWVMMSRGPTFLHMAFGAENEVALMNSRYKDQLEYMWNDTLAFLYLEEAYLLTHPMCKMTGASWYTSGMEELAEEFVSWITNTGLTHIEELAQYGLRPIDTTTTNSPTTEPTSDPTIEPTTPTVAPTAGPTNNFTTLSPSMEPTVNPTKEPTNNPTTPDPTMSPTAPTTSPTDMPTSDPTEEPTFFFTTDIETDSPTGSPTTPTGEPTLSPTGVNDTSSPTLDPTVSPSVQPTTGSPTVSTTSLIASGNTSLNHSHPSGGSGVTSILTNDNGCMEAYVGEVYNDTFVQLTNPTDRTLNCVQQLYQEVKRPMKLRILLDVSGEMSESLGEETRWTSLVPALLQIPTYLEDSANVSLTCFADQLYERGGAGQQCWSGSAFPDGLLEDGRDDMYDYFDEGELLKSDDDCAFFEAFNATYQEFYAQMAADTESVYKYVMMVIFTRDYRDVAGGYETDLETMQEELLDLVGLALEPGDTVPIFALAYYSHPNDYAWETVEMMADRTNGEFINALSDDVKTELKELLYYM